MYNYFMLAGRIIEEPKIEDENDKRKCVIKLEVNRPFSYADGEYKKDVLNITLWDYIMCISQENLMKGMLIMIKGRMQTTEQGIELIGERVMFFNQS